jgi:zinc transport system substrate-binding protein
MRRGRRSDEAGAPRPRRSAAPAPRAAALAALLALLPGALACARERPVGPPLVAVSVLPLAWLVERIAEDRVRVEVMIPPGASEVSYEPALAQLEAVAHASLYVKLGHPAFEFEEAWLDDLLGGRAGLPVLDACAGLPVRDADPHVWTSPRAMAGMAQNVATGLETILPGERAALRANLATLRAEIDALDAEIRGILADRRGARFLVLHPAWGYLAADYDLEQIALQREGKEPGVRELAELVARARADGIRVIFVQPQLDARSATALAAEIGAEIESLDPLAGDWPGNLRHVARRLHEGSAP